MNHRKLTLALTIGCWLVTNLLAAEPSRIGPQTEFVPLMDHQRVIPVAPTRRNGGVTDLANDHSRTFAPRWRRSTMPVRREDMRPRKLAGRVIRVDAKWTVIKENDASRLIVWGNMTTDREGNGTLRPTKFMIIPTYTQTADSPAKTVGVEVSGRLPTSRR